MALRLLLHSILSFLCLSPQPLPSRHRDETFSSLNRNKLRGRNTKIEGEKEEKSLSVHHAALYLGGRYISCAMAGPRLW